jgi:hypothetical protein
MKKVSPVHRDPLYYYRRKSSAQLASIDRSRCWRPVTLVRVTVSAFVTLMRQIDDKNCLVVHSVSGLAGPLGLRLNMRILTNEKKESKIIEAAQSEINDHEAQLIEKYRTGRGDEDERATRDHTHTIDTATATENLKSAAKAMTDVIALSR